MKISGKILNVLRFEDEVSCGEDDPCTMKVVHREHWDETRWGQVYRAVVQVDDEFGNELFRFTHEEPSTENNDPSSYDFDDEEMVEVELVEAVEVVRIEYVPIKES